jgi:ankyrin repeat protein
MYNKDEWIDYIEFNNIEIVKLLLSYKNINVNYQNYWKNTALILASYRNNIEIVKLLLIHPDINIFLKNNISKTALDYAKERKNKEIEILLINHDRKEKLKLLKHV